MFSSLKNWRDRIEEIDQQIISLLIKRLAYARKIGAYKRERELPIEDPQVEMQKRRTRQRMIEDDGGDPRDIETIFTAIVKASRGAQRSARKFEMVRHNVTTISVMGSRGSFSEEAGVQYTKKAGVRKFTLLHPVSAEGVFESLETRQADIGIFPVFNSVGGPVMESIYAMSEHSFFIDDIFQVDIRQCLMGLPGSAKQKITTIMSHPQALAQCAGYLKEMFPKARLVEASDTATSAQFLAAHPKQGNVAVIAPQRCVKLYGLKLFEANIQDQKVNMTTFIAARL